MIEWVYVHGAEDSQDLGKAQQVAFASTTPLDDKGQHEWQHSFAEEKAVDDRISIMKIYLTNKFFAT